MKDKKISVVKNAWYVVGAAIGIAVITTIAMILFSGVQVDIDDIDDDMSIQFALIAIVFSWVAALVSICALFFNKKPERSGIFSAVFILQFAVFIFGLAGETYLGGLILVIVDLILAVVFDALWFAKENQRDAAGLNGDANKPKQKKVQTTNGPISDTAASRKACYNAAFIMMIIETCFMGWTLITLAWLIPMIIMMKNARDQAGQNNEKSHLALSICTLFFVDGPLGIAAGICGIVGSCKFKGAESRGEITYVPEQNNQPNPQPVNNGPAPRPVAQQAAPVQQSTPTKSQKELDLEEQIRIAKLEKELAELQGLTKSTSSAKKKTSTKKPAKKTTKKTTRK